METDRATVRLVTLRRLRPAKKGGIMMGWFNRKETAQPDQVGTFLFAYVTEKLLTTDLTKHLRELLAEEGVPPERRDTFDDTLCLFALFVAFVAARRRYPLPVAEKILAGALNPILSRCNEQAARALENRFDRYHHLCLSSENRGKELAALTYCACIDLYGDEARDPLLMMPVTMWITSYLKVFDDFLSKLNITSA